MLKSSTFQFFLPLLVSNINDLVTLPSKIHHSQMPCQKASLGNFQVQMRFKNYRQLKPQLLPMMTLKIFENNLKQLIPHSFSDFLMLDLEPWVIVVQGSRFNYQLPCIIYPICLQFCIFTVLQL